MPQAATTKRSSLLTWAIWILLAAAVAWFLTGAIRASREASERSAALRHQKALQYDQESFDKQLAGVKSSRYGSILLYSTYDTDKLLRQAEGNPDIQNVQLDQTRISDDAMKSPATLPNLKTLAIVGGEITDRGLAEFRGHPSLAQLGLTSTKVTDDGLRVLRDIPNLKSVMFGPGNFVTLEGLAQLNDAPQLTELRLQPARRPTIPLAKVQGLRFVWRLLVQRRRVHLLEIAPIGRYS